MFKRLILGVAACFASTAIADPRPELFKLLAQDGERLDAFGISVELRESLALIGAGGANAAYLFDVTNPLAPEQIFRLTPSGLQGGRIGGALALSDSLILLGASQDDLDGENAGAALLFDLATGEQFARLQPQLPVEGARFGTAVGISGKLAIVGARSDDFSFEDNYGAVHIFDVSDPQNPVELSKFRPADDLDARSFGESLAVSGQFLAIGAPGSNTAFVYDISDPESPIFITQLIPDTGGNRLTDFGTAIDISHDLVAVTDWFYEGDGQNHSGAVFLFDRKSGEQRSIIVPNDAIHNQNFGVDVSLDRTMLAVGAEADDDNGFLSGSAYLFDITNPLAPALTTKLLPSDGIERQSFGISIALDDELVIVGSDLDNVDNFGAVYLFDGSPPCPADLDCDLDADAEDFFLYLDAFAAGDADVCDLDDDDQCDSSDFFAYLDLFAQLCP